MGILPLGTGNDLARVFGWGSRYHETLVDRLPRALQGARPTLLDCWQVSVTPAAAAAALPSEGEGEGNGEGSDEGLPACTGTLLHDVEGGAWRSAERSVTFHNYLGVGVDAAAALRFHRTRETNPELYVSAVTNKLLYGIFGAMAGKRAAGKGAAPTIFSFFSIIFLPPFLPCLCVFLRVCVLCTVPKHTRSCHAGGDVTTRTSWIHRARD